MLRHSKHVGWPVRFALALVHCGVVPLRTCFECLSMTANKQPVILSAATDLLRHARGLCLQTMHGGLCIAGIAGCRRSFATLRMTMGKRIVADWGGICTGCESGLFNLSLRIP